MADNDPTTVQVPTIQATVSTYWTLVNGDWCEERHLGREVRYYTDTDEDVSPSQGFTPHPADSYDYERGGAQPLTRHALPFPRVNEYATQEDGHVLEIATAEDGEAMTKPLTVVVDGHVVFPRDQYGQEF